MTSILTCIGTCEWQRIVRSSLIYCRHLSTVLYQGLDLLPSFSFGGSASRVFAAFEILHTWYKGLSKRYAILNMIGQVR